ncbi:hypothetical protein D3C79_838800 [compost metagenome]
MQAVAVSAHPSQQRSSLNLIFQGSALKIVQSLGHYSSLLLHRPIECLFLVTQAGLTGCIAKASAHVVDTRPYILEVRFQFLQLGLPTGFKNACPRGIGANHRRLQSSRGFQDLPILLEAQLLNFFDHCLLPGQPVVGDTRDNQ